MDDLQNIISEYKKKVRAEAVELLTANLVSVFAGKALETEKQEENEILLEVIKEIVRVAENTKLQLAGGTNERNGESN